MGPFSAAMRQDCSRVFALLAAMAVSALAVSLAFSAKPAEATFPGTNGKIVYVSSKDGDLDIYTMNPDGSDKIKLTRNSAFDYTPTFSSDGSKIAFASNRDGDSEIFLMNADGSNQTQLTHNDPVSCGGPCSPCDPSEDNDPAFSPDGSRIVFVSCRETDGTVTNGNRKLFSMNLDGTDQMRITDTIFSFGEGDPEYSPDGDKIAFTGLTPGPVSGYLGEIWIMNPDGSELQRLVERGYGPSFSPDGERIAWSDGSAIYAINSDGTDQTRLTRDAGIGGAGFDLSFSPNGRRIVFERSLSGNKEIYNKNLLNGSKKRLTNNLTSDSAPNWGVAAQ